MAKNIATCLMIPANVAVDDDTIIIIDGVSTITLAGFFQVNEFDRQEKEEIPRSLHKTGEYRGGGGAQPEYRLTLLTHKVSEFRLWKLRRIHVGESVFFEDISPECLADATEQIACELHRSFTIGGVLRGTRIWRTA